MFFYLFAVQFNADRAREFLQGVWLAHISSHAQLLRLFDSITFRETAGDDAGLPGPKLDHLPIRIVAIEVFSHDHVQYEQVEWSLLH